MSDVEALARQVARSMPAAAVSALVTALRTSAPAVAQLQHGAYNAATQDLLKRAGEAAKNGDGPYLAGLIRAFRDSYATRPEVTPVWTGPTSSVPGERLTLAVVAGLIDEAESEIVLVSYATLPSVEVRDALRRAVARQVNITTLLERSVDNPSYSGSSNPLGNLPHAALAWPATERPLGASMHAKILVVDRKSALVGSANLTGYGVERNLECSLLVRGGHLPAALAKHVLNADGLVMIC
ncbi:phosphatidylserine/phosphatidylglycerophosphate/cardiolipin synthase-like enzyme [Friedmanniella endophytica]|uniref:Phosphatidylserine/phosphatidylglycerophosphate/ cardiolipin synthase-like enzyme n=1 Tax=Microlunatus kandeliicorticis TaxID=1759536 RepID=A0A7W3IPI1_9ACTN|nr:DISARM system phospholipase D-like protein DrmC [Microlunatus kandeliicorticis]MBA8792844.1 phosphatidylserine/phosphatidylglycerophosphate/cardiolipin synthase-like enzyme [Microlunatus kandeliicorticis]